MNVYEIRINKNTNIKEIIINFPKNNLKLLKTLDTFKYFRNTNTVVLTLSKDNIQKLIENNYIEYRETPIIIDLQIQNNLVEITGNVMSIYQLMKLYSFLDFSKCYRYGKFDGTKIEKVEFFIPVDINIIQLPIGFLNELQQYTNNIVDYRKKRKWKFTDTQIKNCLGYLQLYDVQIKAVKKCLIERTGIIDLVGGLGKTEIMISLCTLTKLKTLIITESVSLCKQTYERCKKAGLDAGIVQGSNVKENHQVIICTIQSSHKLQNTYQMFLVDEVHHVSPQYFDILANKNTLYRFGFSASVFGKDKLKNAYVKAFIGDIIFTKTNQELIENNKIAKPIFNIYKINKPKDLFKVEDWSIIEELGLIKNTLRNHLILGLCKKFKNQTLILIKKIEHGEILEKLLTSANIKCAFLHGSIEKEEREKVLKDFEINKDFILIGSTILQEGISLNSILHLILAGGGKAFVSTLQSVFRGTRVKLKDEFNVYDFLDEFNPLTLKHSKERIKLYREKIYDNIKIY